ncbi:MAG: prepilin-type N-terminal cleavage/methylation domain-containing protein [Phycisphaerae bacterium]|nr:prepilin-type N-terminal cleavage/methylation domain-containing protein [Phycisphaerae bacterium]
MTGIGNIGKNPETTQRKTKRPRGFTLIELIIVIAIIAILTAIGLYVGDKVLKASKTKETVANMQIIMHAVEIYQEEYEECPKHNANDSFKGNVLLDIFKYGESPEPSSPNTDHEEFWDAKIKPIIDKLPGNAFVKTGNTATGFKDAFDVPFVFEPAAGLGGTPRLVSSGPDELFGSVRDGSDWLKLFNPDGSEETWGTTTSEKEKREEAAKDDIISDK